MSTDMLDAPREGESFREEGSFNVKHIQDGKEAALRKKVAEAQQVAAVEKVRVRQDSQISYPSSAFPHA